jgi:hypothetical protein
LRRTGGAPCPDDALGRYDLDRNVAINPVHVRIVQSLLGSCEPPRDVCP